MKKTAVYESIHDKSNEFKIFLSQDDDTPPHFHRCIEILYITEGQTRGEVDGEPFYAEKDDIVFVRRCAVHEIAPAPAYKNYVLIVKSAYADDFSPALEKETLPPLLSDKEFNRSLLPVLLNIEQAGDSFLVQTGYTDVLIGSLLAHYERRAFTPTPNLSAVVSALNYIDEHFAEPITLGSLAELFGYNKYYFSRLFNAYIGENLNNYINMVRVHKLVDAARRAEKVNFSDLAYDFGFESMTTFYRHFERIYKGSPGNVLRA